MTKNELIEKIEALNEWEALMEEAKSEAEAIRDAIKAEMLERETEELIAGSYIIRWTSVLSNRFDTTGFKKVYGDLYKAFTKQSASRRFTISCQIKDPLQGNHPCRGRKGKEMFVLKDVWFGQYRPNEERIQKDNEYLELTNALIAAEDNVVKELSKEATKRFYEYMEVQAKIAAEEEANAFARGVCFGIGLMLDVFMENAAAQQPLLPKGEKK